MSNPVLTLQMASLYASGSTSTFTGTGGPYGYSPYTSQFGGVVSSAGLAGEPFNDQVYNVASGDEVTFVVAVQNLAATASAYGVTLAAPIPTGFAVPPEGANVTITDGTGTDLATTGDLFSNAGLTLGTALAPYDANSGLNLVLLTYTLQATQALPGPNADIPVAATLRNYTAGPGGPNLAATPVSIGTDVISAAPTPVVTPETDPTAVAKGQTIAFDVTLALPAGTLPNLRLAPVLTQGASTLDLVSSTVTGIGAGLTLGTPTIGTDGAIAFGTVTSSPTATAAADTITARFVVRADGTASGTATLHTVVSTSSPNGAGGTWSADVASSVGVIVPPPPPVITGLATGLSITTATAVNPFASLVLTPSGQATSGTIAVTTTMPALGTLFTHGAGALNPAGTTFIDTGTFADLQAAIRQLAFSGAAVGTEGFTITLVDSAGGIAQNTATTVGIAAAPSVDPLFDPAYYLAQNPDVAAAGVDPYTHYQLFGWKEGRNPNAYFDTRYYLRANPDVAAAGVNPLIQFETAGWQQGRDPSLAFSVSGYLAGSPDVRAAGVDPLVHFLQFGLHEGRAAIPVGFDGNLATADLLVNAGYFDAQLGAYTLPAGTTAQAQAAELYNATGWHQGLNPDAWFDTNYYLAQNPDVKASGGNPLLHFELYGWKEGRAPSLLFDDAKYLAANPDVRAANGNPLTHYIVFGQSEGRASFLGGGIQPSDLLVDTAYYDRQLGATLIPGGAAGNQQAVWSYDTTGWQKGLNPDAWFDTSFYLAHNPDVAAAHVDPLVHYEIFGWKEGRDPSAAFSTSKYLAAYADVKAANMDPLLHYIAFGQQEGRTAFAV